LRNVVHSKKVQPFEMDELAHEHALLGPARRHLSVLADEPSSAPSTGVCVLLL
jgi:hypothetical protein